MFVKWNELAMDKKPFVHAGITLLDESYVGGGNGKFSVSLFVMPDLKDDSDSDVDLAEFLARGSDVEEPVTHDDDHDDDATRDAIALSLGHVPNDDMDDGDQGDNKEEDEEDEEDEEEDEEEEEEDQEEEEEDQEEEEEEDQKEEELIAKVQQRRTTKNRRTERPTSPAPSLDEVSNNFCNYYIDKYGVTSHYQWTGDKTNQLEQEA